MCCANLQPNVITTISELNIIIGNIVSDRSLSFWIRVKICAKLQCLGLISYLENIGSITELRSFLFESSGRQRAVAASLRPGQ